MIKPPKNHTIWVQYPLENELYILTSYGEDRTKYYLFKQSGEEWIKLGQNANPNKLEEKVFNKK